MSFGESFSKAALLRVSSKRMPATHIAFPTPITKASFLSARIPAALTPVVNWPVVYWGNTRVMVFGGKGTNAQTLGWIMLGSIPTACIASATPIAMS